MKNKKIIFAALAFVLVAALLVGVYFLTRPKVQEGSKSFSVTVVHSNGNEQVYQYKTDAEYLGAYLVEQGLIIESDSPGLYNTVDGETVDYAKNQSWWCFYINGEQAMEGMNTTPITDGASYKLEYKIGF